MSSEEAPPSLIKRAMRLISPSASAPPDRQGLPSPHDTPDSCSSPSNAATDESEKVVVDSDSADFNSSGGGIGGGRSNEPLAAPPAVADEAGQPAATTPTLASLGGDGVPQLPALPPLDSNHGLQGGPSRIDITTYSELPAPRRPLDSQPAAVSGVTGDGSRARLLKQALLTKRKQDIKHDAGLKFCVGDRVLVLNP